MTEATDIRYVGSTAAMDFKGAISDADALLWIHARFSTGKSGRPEDRLEALKRSALILAVTAWETYVEDYLGSQFARRLNAATDSVEMSPAANSWLQKHHSDPAGLLRRAAGGWKSLLREYFATEKWRFNSPTTANTRDLSKKAPWR